MVDINSHVDVKGYGSQVAVPATVQEDRKKPQVTEVQKESGAASTTLNDASLRRKEEEKIAAQMSREELAEVVDDISDQLKSIGTNLEVAFKQDEESESVVVLLRERESGKVVKQFPPEETLTLQRMLKELASVLDVSA